MRELRINSDKTFLLLPVADGQPPKTLTIYADGKRIYEFEMPVAKEKDSYSFRYYAPIPLTGCAGKVIRMEMDAQDSFFDAVCLSDSVPRKTDCRPAVHFTADTGWLNDPNGFFYRNGEYHLYFQHNPVNTLWGNMSWGHAVSGDLLHWVQQDTVLYPDEDGTVFSGSAIINEREMPGLPSGCPVFFYTCAGNFSRWSAGKKFVQKIAYSLDGGKSLLRREGTAVAHIEGDNRDPKVYWHEESAGYFMVLYLDGHEFAILRSQNLEEWSMTQRFTLEGARECPDLIWVPVEGGGSKWLFWCADGFYFPGEFDGYRFLQTGDRGEAYATSLSYAAQTCWGEERIISIPWLRCGNKGRTYTGTMGIPRELSLAERDGALRLRQRPVRELAACRHRMAPSGEKGSGRTYACDMRRAVEVELLMREEADFQVRCGTVEVRYEAAQKLLTVSGCQVQEDEGKWRSAEETLEREGQYEKAVRIDLEIEKVSLLLDHEILEVSVNDGLLCAAFETVFLRGTAMQDIAVEAVGEAAVYQIA